MTAYRLDPNILFPTASAGKASDIPSFYATLIAAINSHADNIDGTGFPKGRVYVVTDAAYGADPTGVTDSTAAINSAITAAAAGGVVFFPNGTYLLSQVNVSARAILLTTGVVLVGQSRAAILKLADNQTAGGAVRMIYVANNSYNTGVYNLTLNGNKANNPDASIQSDGIFVSLNSSWCAIENCEIHDCSGDAITIHQNVTDTLVQNCYMHDNAWMTVGLGNAGGQNRITIRKCRGSNNVGGLHIEAAKACGNILFDDCVVDAATGASAIQVVGGATPADFATNVTVRNCILTGWGQVSQAAHVIWSGCRITNADTSSGSPPNQHSAFRVTGQVNDLTVENCMIIEQAAGTSPQAVIVAGDTNNNMSEIVFRNCHVESQGTAQDGYYIQQASGVTISGGRIVGNSGVTAGHYGVNVFALLSPDIGRIRVENVRIEDFPVGIAAQSGVGIHIAALSVVGCEFRSVALTMSSAISFDDGHHPVQSARYADCELFSVATSISAYPTVPVLIGGNRGGAGDYEGNGAPSFTAAHGSTYRRLDGGAGTSLYVNESGSTTWATK